MTWLLFIDESGHDHRTTPYEVRGGVAIHVSSLWLFVQAMRRLELDCFGCQLHEYKKEIKGSTLLSKKRYKFAGQGELLPDGDRRKLCRSFLTKHGVIVMDETEKHQDRRLVTRMESYFTKTNEGQSRTEWIVPTPFFVSSDMTYAIQAADVCIYCVNWGFRLPQRGMDADLRNEIAEMFGADLANPQFRGTPRERDGHTFEPYGIVYVPDPYEARSTP